MKRGAQRGSQGSKMVPLSKIDGQRGAGGRVDGSPRFVRSLLSSRTAPSARRSLTLHATRPTHCIASPRSISSATGLFVPSSHPLRETPAATHTTCYLARRRLQYRVLMASVVFPSLVLSHSQLREALAITATPSSRSFCRHFPHRARPTPGWEELIGQK